MSWVTSRVRNRFATSDDVSALAAALTPAVADAAKSPLIGWIGGVEETTVMAAPERGYWPSVSVFSSIVLAVFMISTFVW